MANRLTQGTLGVPIFVAAVSVAVTALVWATADRTVADQDARRIQNSAALANESIQDRIRVQLRLLRSAKAYVLNSPSVTRAEWDLFTRTVDLPRNYPGVTGLGWAEWVLPGEEPAANARRRALGLPPMGKVAEPGADMVLFLTPDAGDNRRAIGTSMFGHQITRAAMERAMDTGDPVASGRVFLHPDPIDKQPGFLIYMPVYDTPETPDTYQERRLRLRGFVYSPFRAGRLFESILTDSSIANIRAQIYEGATVDRNLIFQQAGARAQNPQRLPSDLNVVGQRWTVVYETTPFFHRNSARRLLFWIPTVGLFVTVLLTALSARQAKATRELQRHALELQRREFHQRLLAHTSSVLSASLNIEHTLKAVARMAVPSFADWCAVDLAEQDRYRRVAAAHVDPNKVKWADELAQQYPPDWEAAHGVPNVIRTGKPELYKELDESMLEAAAQDEEHLRIIREIGFTSVMIVPIVARAKTYGAMTYVWAESKKHYDEEDLRLAEEIAGRAGMAIENALLYQESEEGRREVGRLNEVLESQVRERTAELEATNQELEAFAYSVSHDLRAPLRSVDGFSRSLLDDYGDVLDASGKDYVGRIRAAARRMDELISALLSLSRITRADLDRRTVDISRIAEEAARNAKAAFGPHVEIKVQPGLKAHGDESMLHAVMDNLIGNAVKFSAKSEHPSVEVGKNGQAFFVRDNGVGFNPLYKNKLFAPFERLHSSREYSGSGIGLATVQRIILRHGGRIWAESEEGHGATFHFTLGI